MPMTFIGIDDTDAKGIKVKGSRRGTGRVARAVADELMSLGFDVLWILRHQMFKSSLIRTPGNNSAKSVTIAATSIEDAKRAFDVAVKAVGELAAPDSDAGVALLVGTPSVEALSLARRIQGEYVELTKVLETAERSGVSVARIGNEGMGIIGAFAASVLASTGNDGRVLDIPSSKLRDVRNLQIQVKEVHELGIADVRSVEGEVLDEDEMLMAEELKPVLRGFRPVLYVKKVGRAWMTVRVE